MEILTTEERDVELSRRSFLRGLVAAAVAVQLPDMPIAKQEAVTDAVADQLLAVTIDGQVPSNFSILDMGNGWFRFYAPFKSDGSPCIEVGAAGRPMSSGSLRMGRSYNFNGDTANLPAGDYHFSVMFKPQDRGVVLTAAHLSRECREGSDYIQTAAHNIVRNSEKLV